MLEPARVHGQVISTLGKPSRPDSGRLRLGPILSAAFLLRLAVGLPSLRRDPSWFFNQTTELGRLAESLVSGRGLSSPFGGDTGASAFLAPGYPALVAAVFRLFGTYTRTSEIAILLLQIAFATGSVLAIMLAARHMFGTRVANVAGSIWALSLPLLFLPTLFWESALSTFVLVASLALAVSAAEQSKTWKWISLGALNAGAMLINPALMLALFSMSIWTIYFSGPSARLRLRSALFLTTTWIVLFAPWPIRNLRAMHAFIPMRTNLGYELWQGNRPGSDGGFTPELHPNTSSQEFALYASLGEVGYMHQKRELATSAIVAEPVRFGLLTAKRFTRFWSGLGSTQTSGLIIFHIFVTTSFGLAGLVSLFWKRNRFAWLLLGPMLLFPLPYYLTHADFRFRLVIDPLATILMAYALLHRPDRTR